jgi:hypothetical protein
MTPVIAQTSFAPYSEQGFAGNSEYAHGKKKPVVPEPATYGLILVGIVLGVVVGRRLVQQGLTRMLRFKP